VMRKRRFISAMAIVALVAVSAGGQDESQKKLQEAIRKNAARLMAWSGAREAIIKDLVDTWEQCGAEIDSNVAAPLSCDVYQEKVKQTPIEKLVRVGPLIRLSKEDMEDLKRDIVSAAADAYAYGKTKGSAK